MSDITAIKTNLMLKGENRFDDNFYMPGILSIVGKKFYFEAELGILTLDLNYLEILSQGEGQGRYFLILFIKGHGNLVDTRYTVILESQKAELYKIIQPLVDGMHINTPEVRAGIYDKNLRTKPALPGLMRINLEVQKREASKEFMDYILKLRKNFEGGNISRILDSEPGVCTFEGSTLIYHFTNDPGFVLFLDMHKAKNIKGFEIDNPDLQFVQIIMEPHGALQSAGSMNIMIYPGSKEGVKKLKKSAEEAKKNKDSPNEHAGKIVFIAQQSVETLKPSSAVVDDGWN